MSSARAARNARDLAAQVQRSGIPTLGNAVYRTEFVPADRQNAYLGADTQVNVEAGAFNTKKQVALTQEWANVLNDLLRRGGDNSNGFPGPFEADPDARITVEPATGRTFVPGSPAQIASGTAFGLAEVRNPAVTYKMGSKLNANRRGAFMRVGGDAYRRVISSTLQGLTALPREQIDKLILQGYKYGLANLFQGMGIGFSGGRATGLENFDVATIKQFYDANLKNVDQRRLGSFAAASSARNFASAGKIIDRRTGQPADPAAIVQQFETDGSVRGRYAWAPDVKSGKQRAGLTTHPLRSADGTAIQGAVLDPNAGECNIYGSGPGMGGSGGDNFQLRLYKGKREHRSKSSAKAYGARASADRGMDAPTYYCAPTKAEVIDASRSIYQPGGSRGGNVGLGNALDAIAANINNPNVSSGALAQRYADWSTTPGNFAPQFQVPLDVPGREGKGGFALFQGARVGRQQGRKLSDQFTEQQSNAYLPAQYKAGGRTSARGSTAASPNPFLNM